MRVCSSVSACSTSSYSTPSKDNDRAVEAERAQVAGQHLHRRDAAGLDRLTNSARVANGKSSPPHSPSRCA